MVFTSTVALTCSSKACKQVYSTALSGKLQSRIHNAGTPIAITMTSAANAVGGFLYDLLPDSPGGVNNYVCAQFKGFLASHLVWLADNNLLCTDNPGKLQVHQSDRSGSYD